MNHIIINLYNLFTRQIKNFGNSNNQFKKIFHNIDKKFDQIRHTIGPMFPLLIYPEPRYLRIAITSKCNLGCLGCYYNRGFMKGEQLSYNLVCETLKDAKKLGYYSVMFYGGEPLCHPDIIHIVKKASILKFKVGLTTNAILLKEKIEDLYLSGLRSISIGLYGIGSEYDKYVRRTGAFKKIESAIIYGREKFKINISLNWLITRSACNIETLKRVVNFSKLHQLRISLILLNDLVPYFNSGPNQELCFKIDDRESVEHFVNALIKIKHENPNLISQSISGLKSIPDWIFNSLKYNIPCDRYKIIWIGPDGSVQLCNVTFKLGNIYEKSLLDILYTSKHKKLSRDSFLLKCPKCTCAFDKRVQRYLPAQIYYSN